MLRKSIKKSILVSVIALIMVISIFGLAVEAAEFTIRCHHGLPIGHYVDSGMKLWAEKVDDLTDGRVNIRLFPAAQLYNDIDVVQAVMMGDIDACWDYDHKFFTVLPSVGGYGLPSSGIAGYTGADTVKAVEASYDAFYEGYGPAYENAKNFEGIGLKLIFYIFWSSGANQFGSTDSPILLPEDLKGRNIRCTTPSDAEFYASFGAQPVSLTGGELYEAMARHLINAASTNPQHLVDRKLMEVVDYVAGPAYPSVCIGQIVVNMDYWNKIPEDLQKLIIQAGTETELEFRGTLIEDSKKLNDIARQQTTFIELDAEQQLAWGNAILPFWRKACQDLGPEAMKMYNLTQDFKEGIGIKPFPKFEEVE